jgi:hypothetical protein
MNRILPLLRFCSSRLEASRSFSVAFHLQAIKPPLLHINHMFYTKPPSTYLQPCWSFELNFCGKVCCSFKITRGDICLPNIECDLFYNASGSGQELFKRVGTRARNLPKFESQMVFFKRPFCPPTFAGLIILEVDFSSL